MRTKRLLAQAVYFGTILVTWGIALAALATWYYLTWPDGTIIFGALAMVVGWILAWSWACHVLNKNP